MMIKKQVILTLIYWQTSIEKYVPKHLISLLHNFYWKPDYQNHPSKWTIHEDFKDWVCALAEQFYTVKTTFHNRSQMNKKNLYSTAFSAHLPCLSRHSL